MKGLPERLNGGAERGEGLVPPSPVEGVATVGVENGGPVGEETNVERKTAGTKVEDGGTIETNAGVGTMGLESNVADECPDGVEGRIERTGYLRDGGEVEV